VLPDPFSFTPGRLLTGLDYAFPTTPKIGGLVSGSANRGGHALFIDDAVEHTGCAVLGFAGAIAIRTAVAQGCRGIGRVGRITECKDHYLVAIDGEPAVTFLKRQIDSLTESERELAQRAPMFLGIAMDPFQLEQPEPGDFLIRNIVGIDRSNGVLAVGDRLSVGRRVQFHLRDQQTSSEDLRAVLTRSSSGRAARAALLFSCLGRGAGLYGEAGHDSRVFHEVEGDVPLCGFFCNGEIGPVAGTTYLHGYTSSFAILEEPDS
jgi:small ligand-binding sensory domain FIST